jgi:RNA polymerase sigma-70 factor, ECF subfamily
VTDEEQRWLHAARRREAGAFDRLVEPYIPRAYRLACGITHDREAAADAVQEALLRAYRSLGNLRGESPFWPWFFRIVVNEALKQARSGAKKPMDLPDSATPSVEQAVLDQEERNRIWQAIHQLPPAQRAVILLRYYEDLSEAEMAQVLDVSPGTVKSRLHYARQALERHLTTETAQSPQSVQPGLPAQTAPEPRKAPWWRLTTRLLHGGGPHD